MDFNTLFIKYLIYRLPTGFLLIVKWKVVPSPGVEVYHILPPCSCTTFWQMARPTPVPDTQPPYAGAGKSEIFFPCIHL